MKLRILPLLILLPLQLLAVNDDFLKREEFELVLVPSIREAPLAGANGSLWVTDLWIRNSASEAVIFAQGEPYCHNPFCLEGRPHTIDPMTTSRPQDVLEPLSGDAGLFYVEKRFADQLFFSLRVRDVSRMAESAGTRIPVVRENEMYSTAFELLNVPVNSGRLNLRLYETDNVIDQVLVRVLLLPMHGEQELASVTTVLYPRSRVTDFPALPSQTVLYDLAQVLPIAHTDAIRIRIEPLVPGRFWAYATITNDTTNEVTVVAPD